MFRFSARPSLLLSLGLLCGLMVGCASTTTSNQPLNLAEARYGHSSVTDGRKLFSFNGSTSKGFSKSAEVLDLSTGQSQLLTSALYPRRYGAAVWDADHSVYVLGGMTSGGAAIPVERVDLSTGEVEQLGGMPMPTRYASAVLFQGRILVFGGTRILPKTMDGAAKPHGKAQRNAKPRYDEVGTGLVQEYDLKRHSWRRLADMPHPRATRAVVAGDWVYLVGGYDGKKALSVVQRYQPKTGQWQQLPDLPAPTSAHSVVATRDSLYVLGDYTEKERVYRFDLTSQQWQDAGFGLASFRHTAAAVIGQTLYVTGGTPTGKGPAQTQIQQIPLK